MQMRNSIALKACWQLLYPNWTIQQNHSSFLIPNNQLIGNNKQTNTITLHFMMDRLTFSRTWSYMFWCLSTALQSITHIQLYHFTSKR